MTKHCTHFLASFPFKQLLLYLLTSFITICLFSPQTSISTPYFEGDSSVYALIGKGWITENLIPYRDFFDHKGPFVYAFYALAASCGNIKLGLTFLQTIWLTVDLTFIYYLSRLFLSAKATRFIQGVFLLIFITFIWEGANTEELSLPFSLFPLYITVKHLKDGFQFSQSIRRTLSEFLGVGICIGVHFMTRPNNAVIACICCLVVALYLMQHYQWKRLATITALCFAGCCIAIAPFIIYFAYHSALSDYWFCNIIFNSQYASCSGNCISVLRQISYSPYLFLLPLCIIVNLRQKVISLSAILLLVLLSLASLLVVCMGKMYPHYILLTAPTSVFALVLTLVLMGNEKRRFAAYLIKLSPLLVFAILARSSHKAINNVKVSTQTVISSLRQNPQDIQTRHFCEYKQATELGLLIPASEKTETLNIGLFGSEYLYMNTLPCCRHFILQDWLAKNAPALQEVIKEEIREANPKWILTMRGEAGKSSSKHFSILAWDRYELHAQTSLYSLYHLKQ